MKNKFMVAAIWVMAAACQHTLSPVSTPMRNTEIKNANAQTIVAGHTFHSILNEPVYKAWFDKSYDAYTVDTATVQQIKPLLRQTSMDIFLGSWCGDSKREVPRMLKLLATAGMDTSRVSLIFVDNSPETYKQSPAHEEVNRNIHRVPTFIVYNNNHEAGRIVESPVASLEKDMLAILSKESYTPNYKAVNYWTTHIANRNTPMDDAKLRGLIDEVKPLCKHYGELNTYGYVMLGAKRNQEALNVFRLNTMIYPSAPGVFDSLGEALAKTGDKEGAVKAYKKVLELKPGDTGAITALKALNAVF